MDWKYKVTSVSDQIFPGLSHKIDDSLMGNEVMSNLPLQMSLYFNAVFAPVWAIAIITFLIENVMAMNQRLVKELCFLNTKESFVS